MCSCNRLCRAWQLTSVGKFSRVFDELVVNLGYLQRVESWRSVGVLSTEDETGRVTNDQTHRDNLRTNNFSVAL
jgi:hypothetical protein